MNQTGNCLDAGADMPLIGNGNGDSRNLFLAAVLALAMSALVGDSALVGVGTDLATVAHTWPLSRPDRNPALVYLGTLPSPHSRRTMAGVAGNLARLVSGGRFGMETLPWPALRYQHTTAIRSALVERYAPLTAGKWLSCLRGILRECWRLGYMTAEEYRKAADIPNVRGQTLPAGRALPAGEIKALFDDCAIDPGSAGSRDAALFAVLYGAGLRRAEAVALDLADIDLAAGSLTVRSGKGRKARIVYAANGARAALEAWIAVRGTAPGPLFHPVGKGGHVAPRRMTTQSVRNVCAKRARRAGVAPFSPHDLRRTFISDLLDAGADIASVQRLAGHSSPTTTSRYDRRGEEAKRRTAGMLHVPFVRRPSTPRVPASGAPTPEAQGAKGS